MGFHLLSFSGFPNDRSKYKTGKQRKGYLKQDLSKLIGRCVVPKFGLALEPFLIISSLSWERGSGWSHVVVSV
jgi:hypothetical protein